MATMISETSKVAVSKSQISTDLGGEAVILTLDSGRYFSLNDVGSRVWDLIQEPMSVSDICDAILEEYEVDPTRCMRDIFAILESLASEGLVEVT